MSQLSGKTALVSGAARGIGLAIAGALYDAGATVVLADIDRVEAEKAAAGLGRSALALPLDVSDVNRCRTVVDDAVAQAGQLDILVNNAGIAPIHPIDEVDQALFDRIVAVNLRGLFFLSQAAAQHMRARKCGRIINISSIGGRTGGKAHLPVYVATKAGVFALTKTFASYLAPHGTVNCIAPGPTVSALTDAWDDPQLMEQLRGEIPLGRLGVPADYGGVAVFLASAAADFITGATIDVNGGMRMD
ncbi:MAG: glucose 1-dehydrogenase [Anaerolineaceae bacterium]|nr:glucose 1-dehydrogenase [Anaerolineaceae bacterium]